MNETSARLVAGGVIVMTASAIAFGQAWLVAVIAYGFVARTLSGPTLSPLGQIVTRLITPRLRVTARYVPGPPKRFAQSMGAVISTTAAVLWLGFGLRTAAEGVLGALIAAATLEAVFAFCLGCRIFAILMRLGVIPNDVCEACNNVRLRHPATHRHG